METSLPQLWQNFRESRVRTAFIDTIYDLARRDERITLLVGDLGFGVVEPFARDLPSQFINVGVAEQNMTGMAAGMALSGRIVFTYSIANFPTIRCLEQIRNDVCYHQANVTIVSVGGGMSYGALGPSHHATEDLAIMRALPDMRVLAPGDPVQTEMAVRALAVGLGPSYLRLGRSGERRVHDHSLGFQIGKAAIISEGSDVTFIVTGALLENVLGASEALNREGVASGVVSMHTVKPIDTDAVVACAAASKLLVTVEEHTILGGLGGAVAEVMSQSAMGVPVLRLGLQDSFSSVVGDQEFLRGQHGLDVDGIVMAVRDFRSGLEGRRT